MESVVDRTSQIRSSTILAFSCVRNESLRLPFFLDYHRSLGVGHFLFVVNDSDDDTLELLLQQPDCSVWATGFSYRLSRFGMDWLGYLQTKYGMGHWCLTLDADEIFVYPDSEARNLSELTAWLERNGHRAFGAQLVDFYPQGYVGKTRYSPGQDPREVLTHYDAWNTTHIWQPKHRNQWIQGGPRARAFFSEEPERAPTLNKIPLVHWKRGYSYVTSTHILLPVHLNRVFDATDGLPMIGALVHTKFLPCIVRRASEERTRKQHFENSELYERYYLSFAKDVELYHAKAKRYRGLNGFAEDGIFWRTVW